jgi:hypothetical protein
VLGGDARAAVEAMGLEGLAALAKFRVTGGTTLGLDHLTTLTREA